MIRGFRRDKLIKYRERAKFSQVDLARMVGVTKAAVSHWERDSTPEVERLTAIVEVLSAALPKSKITLDDLVYVKPAERMPSDLRVRLAMGQVQLAARAGMSTTALGGFERGETHWNQDYAERLAPILEVSVDELRAAWDRARLRPPGTPP